MTPRKLVTFVMQAAAVGIVAATVLLIFRPELFAPAQRVVEFREAGPGTGPAPQTGPVSYADAVARAADAIVNIHTAKRIAQRSHPLMEDPFFRYFFGNGQRQPRERLQTSLGSGVIVSPQGYILTNNHVIEEADEILVALRDERQVRATVVGTDPETDLAVLQIELADLPAVTLGDSSDLRIGDVVLAIGNPFGVGQTVTMGIVSATGRNELGINTFEDFIQTDAAINPGNSGGALINALGELVGINTAIYSRSGGSQGIGFAIPMGLARGVLEQIVRHGRVARGWLGVDIQKVTPDLAESFGLSRAEGILISGVYRGGPAHQAGLEPGDIVSRVAGNPVKNPRDALNEIARVPPGTTIPVTAARNGAVIEVEVTVAERPSEAP